MVRTARPGALDVAEIRRRIPGVGTTVYLNTGGFGLMPDVARRAVIEGYTDLATKIDPMAWYTRCREQEVELRSRIGRFVGANADEIALKISLADGYGSVLWGLDWRPGDRVVVSDEEHPSPRLAVELAAKQFGLEVVTLPIRPLDGFLDALRAALRQPTRLVALSHVTTDSGTVLPAREIGRLAHEAGALVLFDGAQALGQGPMDLHELGCDFYAAMGYKWLLGPSGTGLLYARKESQRHLRSVIGSGAVRWTDLPRGRYEEDDTAARFEFAARSWPQYAALGASIELLSQIGLSAIQGRVAGLMARLRTGLGEIKGVRIHTPAATGWSTGIVTFSVDGVPGRDLTARLRGGWNVVQRAAMMVGDQGGVRISLALYTSEDEVDLLTRAVREIAAGG
ncbi:MAG TPA: aminotransferase class V-fold PLP-dependent enzyme [Chloroflexota bacterium]|nr:aminotransferase class V-fold PLP-dependent enzyme [Chloroflexota bacterium]